MIDVLLLVNYFCVLCKRSIFCLLAFLSLRIFVTHLRIFAESLIKDCFIHGLATIRKGLAALNTFNTPKIRINFKNIFEEQDCANHIYLFAEQT